MDNPCRISRGRSARLTLKKVRCCGATPKPRHGAQSHAENRAHFNSAVVPWQDGYIAVLRGEQVNGVPHVYLGRSKDGIHWNVDRERVQFVDENGRAVDA